MPEPYHEQNGVQIFLGDCREVLPALNIQFDSRELAAAVL